MKPTVGDNRNLNFNFLILRAPAVGLPTPKPAVGRSNRPGELPEACSGSASPWVNHFWSLAYVPCSIRPRNKNVSKVFMSL